LENLKGRGHPEDPVAGWRVIQGPFEMFVDWRQCAAVMLLCQNETSGNMVGNMDWIYLVQDRDQWRAVVNTVMNLRFP